MNKRTNEVAIQLIKDGEKIFTSKYPELKVFGEEPEQKEQHDENVSLSINRSDSSRNGKNIVEIACPS